MPTPHIAAGDDAFAEAVLLPGDPLRAQHIADTFLEDATRVTAVRSMFGFTGTYEQMPVSVMGTGMGIPSSLIYATELIQTYGCRRLIRVGSCGAVQPDVALRDVVVGIGACTDSAVNRTRYGGWDFAATSDFDLARAAVDAAHERDLAVHTGNLHSADLFYNPDDGVISTMQRMGVLAVEMEAAGLYGIAAQTGARALAICTVSDQLVTGEVASSADRQRTFDDMVVIALDALRRDRAAD
ncbi:MAG TPA: purine-nucleoside phosphorylase [Euzebyales bacterium]